MPRHRLRRRPLSVIAAPSPGRQPPTERHRSRTAIASTPLGARGPGRTRLSGRRAKECEDGETKEQRGAGNEARSAGAEQGSGHVERRRATRGAEADQGRGRRARPLLVHGSRGASEVVRDHAQRDGGRARRRDGLRRLVDHRLQPDRGVGHGRDPGSGDVRAHAAARRRPRPRARLQGRPHDLRRRQARRHAVRGRPALHPQARPRADEEDGLRHVQRRPGARVLPLRGRQGHRDDRRGWLLRDDRAGRGDRGAQRHDRGARVGRASRSSTTTTRSPRRSTRSTCATTTRSRWPTRR